MKKVNREKRENKKIDFFLNMLLIIFIIMFLYAVIEIGKWYFNKIENEKIGKEIANFIAIKTENIELEKNNETQEKYEIGFATLKKKNKDTVAFLKVKGTDVENIVVKGNDNEYYLSHNFEKKKNKGGWVFADYKNKIDGTDKNLIVYGHNMKNGSMFGTLKNILKPEWYNNEENYEIDFITEIEEQVYRVFSVYQIKDEDYYIKTEFKNNQFQKFIETLKKRSIKDFNVEVTGEDSILTLSTCANNNNYRVVLHAKRIK